MLSAETGDFLGLCVVTTVLAALAGWIVAMLRRSPFSPIQSVLYAVNYLLARVLWRAKIQGSLDIPPGCGAVIVCNHRCPLDPSFLAIATNRVIHWMVAKEYCEMPVLGYLLRTCEVIPLRRGSVDMAAIREAIRLVENGELVGIFPEGRINTTKQLLLPGRSGAAMIALKAKAMVVPCYIEGSPYDGTTLGCLTMPASVRLEIGQPIDISAYFKRDDRRTTLAELTRRFLSEIAKLASQPNFVPQTAGSIAETVDTSR
jgi:1-acyl-sn-glycerol-3-phosphate acyltransferase